MDRIPHSEDDLRKYIGKQVSKEALLGRNYFYVERGRVVEDLCLHELQDFHLTDNTDFKHFYETVSFPKKDDCLYDESEDNEDNDRLETESEEITGERVKAFLATKTTQSGWFKCLPSHPEDVEPGTAYIIVRVRVDEDFKITQIHAFTRFMDGMNGGFGFGGFFVDVPHSESMSCHVSHMPLFPPEVIDELESLCKARYLKKGFSFIGKPLPSQMFFMNGGGNCKTSAKGSAFRNAYWHISIDHDDEDKIEDFEFSCWENEHSMFQRPTSVSEDIMDGLDCALTLLDAYTDEEYKSLNN